MHLLPLPLLQELSLIIIHCHAYNLRLSPIPSSGVELHYNINIIVMRMVVFRKDNGTPTHHISWLTAEHIIMLWLQWYSHWCKSRQRCRRRRCKGWCIVVCCSSTVHSIPLQQNIIIIGGDMHSSTKEALRLKLATVVHWHQSKWHLSQLRLSN